MRHRHQRHQHRRDVQPVALPRQQDGTTRHEPAGTSGPDQGGEEVGADTAQDRDLSST